MGRLKIQTSSYQARKGAQTQTFGSGDPPAGGGLSREGVGLKNLEGGNYKIVL